jgi:hypothetical protein
MRRNVNHQPSNMTGNSSRAVQRGRAIARQSIAVFAILAGVFLSIAHLTAQNTGSLLVEPKIQFFTSAGVVCNGCKVYTYAAGGTTPLSTYSDNALSTANANPVVLDSAGRATIYLSRTSYRIDLKTSADVSIWSQDNVYDLSGLFQNTNRTANTVFAGPSSGSPAPASFRTLVPADLSTTAFGIDQVDGRLTLTSGTPVPTSDVTGASATTVYFTPYKGNRVALYSGSEWEWLNFSQISIAVPSTTNQMYDVYAYNNGGTATLETLAWTSDTTRATALTTQDGVYVRSGSTTRRYLGSFRTTTVSGQSEDSLAKRLLWNYYNRVRGPVERLDTTDSWQYTTATIRQAGASTSNQIAIVEGVAEDAIQLGLSVSASNTSVNTVAAGIGKNSTSTFTVGQYAAIPQVVNQRGSMFIGYADRPAAGYHFYSWNEYAEANGTQTWYGDGGGALIDNGLTGTWSY